MKRLLSAVKLFLYRQFTLYFSHILLAQGVMRGVGERRRLLLVMPRHSVNEGYFLRRVFGDEFQVLVRSRVFLPRLKVVIDRHAPDLCFADLPPRWLGQVSRFGAIETRSFIWQGIDLHADLAIIKQRFRTRNKPVFNRHAGQGPFDVRLSNDLRDFDHFYQRMFLPHIERQFAGFVAVDGQAVLRAVFSKGFLLIASKNGVDVAATLCYETPETLRYHRAGVLDGDEQHVRDGAQAALYVQMILRAKANGRARLDLGLSRPFFDDGVFHYKRGWGARVGLEEPEGATMMYVMQVANPNAMKEFLSLNPMLGCSGNDLVAWVALGPRAEAPELSDLALLKAYGVDGLAGIQVLAGPGKTARFIALN